METKENYTFETLKQKLGQGVSFGFAPRRLEITWKPEWYNFPFNVMFASQTVQGGKTIVKIALYEPDFHTYKKEGDSSSMRYHNIYGGDCYLIIRYNEKNKQHIGEKYINGELIVSAYGHNNWQSFFFHLTLLGVAANEKHIEFEAEE